MRRNENCWDNAPKESCFDTLKTEREPDLFTSGDGHCNRQRHHSGLGHFTPEQAERQSA
ncbi:MAG: hypothetical protein ACREC9_03205 [Methylocella sp.]